MIESLAIATLTPTLQKFGSSVAQDLSPSFSNSEAELKFEIERRIRRKLMEIETRKANPPTSLSLLGGAIGLGIGFCVVKSLFRKRTA